MKLYIMRHGPAEEAADSELDDDRTLTALGTLRVRKVASALLEADEQPLSVFTSPIVRAVQTAEIVALVTNLAERDGGLWVRRELAPGRNAAEFVRQIASEGKRRVMLVGHEPDLSVLVSTFIGVPFCRPFEKAMVVSLSVSPGEGSARWRFLLDPKTLELRGAPQ